MSALIKKHSVHRGITIYAAANTHPDSLTTSLLVFTEDLDLKAGIVRFRYKRRDGLDHGRASGEARNFINNDLDKSHKAIAMDFKKIIVLENNNEDCADNSYENSIIAHSFPAIPVDYWYRFYYGFTKYDKEIAWYRFSQINPKTTLLLTYTTLVNGVLSGYGDLIKMWLQIFEEVCKRGYSVNICVMTSPAFGWELIKWIQSPYSKSARNARGTLVRKLLRQHNLYMMKPGDRNFQKDAILIDHKWLRNNMFEYATPFIMDGVECQLQHIYVNHSDEVQYGYCQHLGNNRWGSGSGYYLPIEKVKRLLGKKTISS